MSTDNSPTIDDYQQALANVASQKAASNHNLDATLAGIIGQWGGTGEQIASGIHAVRPWIKSAYGAYKTARSAAKAFNSRDPEDIRNAKNDLWNTSGELLGTAAASAAPPPAKKIAKAATKAAVSTARIPFEQPGTPEHDDAKANASRDLAEIYPDGNTTKTFLKAAAGDQDSIIKIAKKANPFLGESLAKAKEVRDSAENIKNGVLDEYAKRSGQIQQLRDQYPGIEDRIRAGQATPEDIEAIKQHVLGQQDTIHQALSDEMAKRGFNVTPEFTKKLAAGQLGLDDLHKVVLDNALNRGSPYLKQAIDASNQFHEGVQNIRSRVIDAQTTANLHLQELEAKHSGILQRLQTGQLTPEDEQAINDHIGRVSAQLHQSVSDKLKANGLNVSPELLEKFSSGQVSLDDVKKYVTEQNPQSLIPSVDELHTRVAAGLRTIDNPHAQILADALDAAKGDPEAIEKFKGHLLDQLPTAHKAVAEHFFNTVGAPALEVHQEAMRIRAEREARAAQSSGPSTTTPGAPPPPPTRPNPAPQPAPTASTAEDSSDRPGGAPRPAPASSNTTEPPPSSGADDAQPPRELPKEAHPSQFPTEQVPSSGFVVPEGVSTQHGRLSSTASPVPPPPPSVRPPPAEKVPTEPSAEKPGWLDQLKSVFSFKSSAPDVDHAETQAAIDPEFGGQNVNRDEPPTRFPLARAAAQEVGPSTNNLVEKTLDDGFVANGELPAFTPKPRPASEPSQEGTELRDFSVPAAVKRTTDDEVSQPVKIPKVEDETAPENAPVVARKRPKADVRNLYEAPPPPYQEQESPKRPVVDSATLGQQRNNLRKTVINAEDVQSTTGTFQQPTLRPVAERAAGDVTGDRSNDAQTRMGGLGRQASTLIANDGQGAQVAETSSAPVGGTNTTSSGTITGPSSAAPYVKQTLPSQVAAREAFAAQETIAGGQTAEAVTAAAKAKLAAAATQAAKDAKAAKAAKAKTTKEPEAPKPATKQDAAPAKSTPDPAAANQQALADEAAKIEAAKLQQQQQDEQNADISNQAGSNNSAGTEAQVNPEAEGTGNDEGNGFVHTPEPAEDDPDNGELFQNPEGEDEMDEGEDDDVPADRPTITTDPVPAPAADLAPKLATDGEVVGDVGKGLNDTTDVATGVADSADGNVLGAVLNFGMLGASTVLGALGLTHTPKVYTPPPPVVQAAQVAQTNSDNLFNPTAESSSAI